MSDNTKPRVIKDFEKLETELQEQIKLAYPDGFYENLILNIFQTYKIPIGHLIFSLLISSSICQQSKRGIYSMLCKTNKDSPPLSH
jgi:hypothetical protein